MIKKIRNGRLDPGGDMFRAPPFNITRSSISHLGSAEGYGVRSSEHGGMQPSIAVSFVDQSNQLSTKQGMNCSYPQLLDHPRLAKSMAIEPLYQLVKHVSSFHENFASDNLPK